MKKLQIPLLATLLIVALPFSPLLPVSMATDNSPISTKELRVLLKTAKEPAEHRNIAGYYTQEATRLIQSGKNHAKLAKLYDEHEPFPAMVSKHGAGFGQGAPHCHRWAELSTEQAKEAEALAALHEDMAKASEQK